MADSTQPLGLLTASASAPSRDLASLVDRYFQVSLFLLIAVGFATIFATGRLDSISVLFVGIALVLRAYLLLKNRELKIPEKWTNYLTLLYVIIFAVDLFLISGSYVTASVHLVLFSMVVKIFSVQRERDYLYLAVLAFLAVLAASVLTVDTLFFGAFILFVLLAVNTFVSMEIRRSLRKAKHHGQIPSPGEQKLAASLSANAVMIVLSIVVGSGVLFFMLPRFSAGYLSAFSPHSDLVTGFSDNVSLGAIGRIQQTDQVVMHVQTDQPVNAEMKWRGLALTVFDGKAWTNQADTIEEQDSYAGRYMLRRLEARRLNLPAQAPDSSEFRLLRYRIVLEPIGTNVVFLASVPVELNGNFREIGIDGNGSITNIDRNRMTESYEAVSQIAQPSLDALRAASGNYPIRIVRRYLQLPSLDPRVPELAEKITANSRSDYDKAAALENYLRTNFGYTLQLPEQTPDDPIANFLFVRKQGHCEYFASAMAIMLRSLGIPSRLVNGFRNGEYNDLTGSYIVRARNAHTWVEAYIPSAGWVSFDPTPADSAPVASSWNRLRLYLDAAQEFWREWVINYDFGHQRALTITAATEAQRHAFDVRRWLQVKYWTLLKRARRLNQRVTNNPRAWVALLVAAILFVVGLWNLRRIVRALRRQSIAARPSRAPSVAATIWYAKMLKRVARQGYRKLQTQTPEEFVRAIPPNEAALRESVAKFTERYQSARFGNSATDAEQLPSLYEEIVPPRK